MPTTPGYSSTFTVTSLCESANQNKGFGSQRGVGVLGSPPLRWDPLAEQERREQRMMQRMMMQRKTEPPMRQGMRMYSGIGSANRPPHGFWCWGERQGGSLAMRSRVVAECVPNSLAAEQLKTSKSSGPVARMLRMLTTPSESGIWRSCKGRA